MKPGMIQPGYCRPERRYITRATRIASLQATLQWFTFFVFIFFLTIPVWFGRQIYRSSVTEWNTEADVSRLDPSVLVSFAVPSPSVIVRDMSFGSLPSVDEETVLNGPPTEVADSGAFYFPSPICRDVTQRPPPFLHNLVMM